MNRRLLIILLCAFLVAAGASYLVYRVAGNQIRAAGAQKPTSKIVVAARDLQIGTLIHESDLRMSDWTGALPKGAMIKADTAVNRGVISTLYEGEPIIESRLAPTGSGAGLAATIQQGMRACAVKVDEVVGLAGFVVPGMRVDVLVSGVPPNAPPTEGQKVKTILQNIEVLSAGTNIQKDTEGKPVQVQVVNLLVAPEQAEILSLASNQRIQLVLRNPLDTQIATPPAIAMASLFSDLNAPAPVKAQPAVTRRAPMRVPHIEKAPAPELFLIEVLNGSKRSEQKFSPAEETK
jgi:pilus assembly protein CpaB